jgi:hypothetical protein
VRGDLGYGWFRVDRAESAPGFPSPSDTILAPATRRPTSAPSLRCFKGYLDLGTWYGLTPYIGAGAGASRIKVSDYTSTLAPPFTPGLTNTQWKFA